jgi:hypothetical protein
VISLSASVGRAGGDLGHAGHDASGRARLLYYKAGKVRFSCTRKPTYGKFGSVDSISFISGAQMNEVIAKRLALSMALMCVRNTCMDQYARRATAKWDEPRNLTDCFSA